MIKRVKKLMLEISTEHFGICHYSHDANSRDMSSPLQDNSILLKHSIFDGFLDLEFSVA